MQKFQTQFVLIVLVMLLSPSQSSADSYNFLEPPLPATAESVIVSRLSEMRRPTHVAQAHQRPRCAHLCGLPFGFANGVQKLTGNGGTA